VRCWLVSRRLDTLACQLQQSTNPIHIEWHFNGEVKRYRLWAFEITHGGGGEKVRPADEFRIQITKGPPTIENLDSRGAVDLLIGYSRDQDAIAAYDRRWLEGWSRKKERSGRSARFSPSAQVKQALIKAGHDEGIHHLTKHADFGEAQIVTMKGDAAGLPSESRGSLAERYDR
jgi:hypothetical protein